MAAYYFDTSALIKRYVVEQGTTWVTSITDSATGRDIFMVRVTGPEIIAALFRKVRTRELSRAKAVRAANLFKNDWQVQYQIVEIDANLANEAMKLAEKHGLRGYDAIHLAAALELEKERQLMGGPTLVFVSADDQQLKAAIAERLPVENANHHP